MAQLRAQLDGARGPRYWRVLEELSGQPAFRQHLQQAAPQLASLEPMLDRRGFIKLLGASLAMAGLTACSGPPPEYIVPRIRELGMPASLPQFYATTLSAAGEVAGVLVETHEGRPGKIEGNPDHPASLGATDAWLQAAVLQLWDPDRSTAPYQGDRVATWDAFAAEVPVLQQRAAQGGGLHILSGRIDSPTLAAQRQALLARYPQAHWHVFEPVDQHSQHAGAQLAFGQPLRPRYRLRRAQRLLTLEADLFGTLPGRLQHARDAMAARRPEHAEAPFSRIYAIEPTPSITGARADHAWPLASSAITALVQELAAELGIAGVRAGNASGLAPRRLRALAQDLREHRGSSLVVAGPAQPAYVHALVHLINQSLGNVGHTVEYFLPPEDAAAAGMAQVSEGLAGLTAAIDAGSVDTLLVLDANPVYSAPADLRFAERLGQVPHRIHLGLYRDETARACHWHLPRSHALEAWSDARAWDGIASLVQPVLAPLYDTRSIHQLLAMLLGESTDIRARVQETWRRSGADDFDAFWRTSLQAGVIADSLPAAQPAVVDTGFLSQPPAVIELDQLELVFRPDDTIYDGRYANNAWLQELPKPLSKLTWSNAALISPALAQQLELKNGDTATLRIGQRQVQAPVWILPGQAARSVTAPLGYGRPQAGQVGAALGFDAYRLRSAAAPWREEGLALRPDGGHLDLPTTQHHHAMEGREPVRAGTLAQFLAQPDFASDDQQTPPSFYPEHPPGEYAWAMSIDLNSCIGCGACTIACQAENNIPVVGPEEVRRGREMHWIRIDRYYEGEAQAPRTHHQPVPCMHCEHAPCEVVCPVGATMHDSGGLNLQIYNRCVGTRFCSNNCPYKVRRFNFLQYASDDEHLAAQRNPDVTVRNRGVMEKCTYCVQRIQTAHIAANKDDRPIAEGEVVTACQAVCPTRAITFGNGADPASAVSQAKASPRNYALLQELNTRPRTTYLASLRNPHPDLGEDA